MQNNNSRVLLTGASGFVGSALCAHAARLGWWIRGAVRIAGAASLAKEEVAVGQIGSATDWSEALKGVDVVIHLAARVHVMQDKARDPLAEFREVNTAGTENLARQAAQAGVKRLVYVSSIKVNGEQTSAGAFTEADSPKPLDPYGISKWEAEQALQRVAAETGLEVVIIRPPLIYGPEVKGNFAQMLKVLARGIPLPFSAARNQRSLLYVQNLADALLVCATHPAAAGQTFLVSDGEDVSTPELLRRLGQALESPAKIFWFPLPLLEWAGHLVGKRDQVDRLLGSLRVDSSKIRHTLDWVPPYTMQQGLKATADWYRKQIHG